MNGLGNDIIEVDRIRDAHKEHGQPFLDRLFTPKELTYCLSCQDPYPRLAGRFAAKEAIAKALGTGFGAALSWKDIEILPDENGEPIVHLSESAREKFPHMQLLVSISHAKAYATAVALVQFNKSF